MVLLKEFSAAALLLAALGGHVCGQSVSIEDVWGVVRVTPSKDGAVHVYGAGLHTKKNGSETKISGLVAPPSEMRIDSSSDLSGLRSFKVVTPKNGSVALTVSGGSLKSTITAGAQGTAVECRVEVPPGTVLETSGVGALLVDVDLKVLRFNSSASYVRAATVREVKGEIGRGSHVSIRKVDQSVDLRVNRGAHLTIDRLERASLRLAVYAVPAVRTTVAILDGTITEANVRCIASTTLVPAPAQRQARIVTRGAVIGDYTATADGNCAVIQHEGKVGGTIVRSTKHDGTIQVR